MCQLPPRLCVVPQVTVRARGGGHPGCLTVATSEEPPRAVWPDPAVSSPRRQVPDRGHSAVRKSAGGGEPQGTQRAVDLLRVTLRSAGFSLKNREVRLLGNVWVFTDSGHSR